MNGHPARQVGATVEKSAFCALVLAIVLTGGTARVQAGEDGLTVPVTSREASRHRTCAIKINIKIQEKLITATLADNDTKRRARRKA